MSRASTVLYHKFKRVPWFLLCLICITASLGFAMLYSAANGALHPWCLPQMIRFSFGLGVMFTIAMIPLNLWLRLAYVSYGISIILLVAVHLFGDIGMGAQRWLDLGILKIQPSEVAKITTILALARYFHRFPPHKHTSLLFIAVPMAMIAVPLALILKQPNLGTATLLGGICVWMMFASGMHRRYFVFGLIAIAVAAPVAWQTMHDYQKRRVMTFLNPSADPLGDGYNITQSIIAIGSGGLTGRGFTQGSQTQLDFLPEKQTDFIFTVLAEELGFLGGALLLCTYTAMIISIIGMAYHSASLFGMLIAHGIAAMLSLHLLINTGMVMGMLPVVGIPLPLLSYGGSIMLSIQIAFGLVMNVWVHRDEKLTFYG
ncbi:MAG: rod shape-determining protein RodA [Alphaproteobacteria bacterium]|nr:MAG: rod shape-determining protein RodA [Alphaproteobacteria bacterium]TAF74969.1 MAG: rod shape-determining protein RodA [Alphaproteobacteria bacterium]